MDDIKFKCTFCKQSLEAPPDMAGETIECPSCLKSVTIPRELDSRSRTFNATPSHSHPSSTKAKTAAKLRQRKKYQPARSDKLKGGIATQDKYFNREGNRPKIVLGFVGIVAVITGALYLILSAQTAREPSTYWTMQSDGHSWNSAPLSEKKDLCARLAADSRVRGKGRSSFLFLNELNNFYSTTDPERLGRTVTDASGSIESSMFVWFADSSANTSSDSYNPNSSTRFTMTSNGRTWNSASDTEKQDLSERLSRNSKNGNSAAFYRDALDSMYDNSNGQDVRGVSLDDATRAIEGSSSALPPSKRKY